MKGKGDIYLECFQDLYQTKARKKYLSRRTLESFDVHVNILVMINRFLSADPICADASPTNRYCTVYNNMFVDENRASENLYFEEKRTVGLH
jgi:hypothetical protein